MNKLEMYRRLAAAAQLADDIREILDALYWELTPEERHALDKPDDETARDS